MPSEVHDWIIRLALHKIVGDIFLSWLLQARCQMLGAFAVALAHDVVIVARALLCSHCCADIAVQPLLRVKKLRFDGGVLSHEFAPARQERVCG